MANVILDHSVRVQQSSAEPTLDKINSDTSSQGESKLFQVEDYVERQTLLLESIKKVQAQAYVALSDDFCNYDQEIIHYYLWALSDNLELTTNMLEGLIDDFRAIKKT